MASRIKTIHLFYHPENRRAVLWDKKIRSWLKRKKPHIKISGRKPDAVIVLGGDGTMLEATRKYAGTGSLIVGFNLGTVGFLASVRKPAHFMKRLNQLFDGRYKTAERMLIKAGVKRAGKNIFTATALNEIAVQSPLGMVELKVMIEDHPFQFIRGTGVLVATPTGSTAQNLSAHGPIVTPDIKCFIITELADHNTPTPSIVIKKIRTITVSVENFRQKGSLTLAGTGQKADALLVIDGEALSPLNKKDKVIITKAPKSVKFAEFENHYFLKSLQEKFAFE